MRVMAAPRKYPDEPRERATRMAVDARRDPATRTGALKRIAEQLGINAETLRNWVIQAEIDEGHRPGTTTDDATRLAELEREVRELRRANAILKSASAFFAAELARPPADRRLHRSAQARTRGRADLPGPHRGRREDRPEQLLRAPVSAALGAVGHRRGDHRGHRAGARRELRCLRRPEGACRAAPAGPRRGPVHRRAADAH